MEDLLGEEGDGGRRVELALAPAGLARLLAGAFDDVAAEDAQRIPPDAVECRGET